MGPLQGWRSRRCCGELRLGVVAPRGFVRNHFFVNDLKIFCIYAMPCLKMRMWM